jgi:hypothetical protein
VEYCIDLFWDLYCFIIFINDMVESGKTSEIFLNTDDIKVYKHIHSSSDS